MTKVLCGAVALLVFILSANGCARRVERTVERDVDAVPVQAALVVAIEVRR